MTLLGTEFLRRFFLSQRFVRIRHFGFLANRFRGTLLPLCREFLTMLPEPACHHRERFMRLALPQVWRGNGCRSEVQRGGTVTMRLLRFLVGPGTGRIIPGGCTTLPRRCAPISCAAPPVFSTVALDTGTKTPFKPHSCRLRRTRQRLPSRLLIENASARRARLRPALICRGVSDQG